jgi:hypothetical protein
VQSILMASGGAGLEELVTRRWRATLTTEASHFRVLDEPVGVGTTTATPTVPRQTALSATPGAALAVTRLDDLALTIPVSVISFGGYTTNGVEIFSVAPTLGWQTRRRANTELRLTAGLSYDRDLGTSSVIAGGSALLPTGSGEIMRTLFVAKSCSLFARARLTVQEYVDPVLAAISPRAVAGGQLLLTVAPDWSFALLGDGSASLRRVPLPSNPDETAFSIRVPIRHRVSTHISWELGGYWADRAPALASPSFAFHQRQLWAYFALTVTTRDLSGWSVR